MGKGGARTGKGRFEGSGETDTSFEESGKGTCIFIISSPIIFEKILFFFFNSFLIHDTKITFHYIFVDITEYEY